MNHHDLMKRFGLKLSSGNADTGPSEHVKAALQPGGPVRRPEPLYAITYEAGVTLVGHLQADHTTIVAYELTDDESLQGVRWHLNVWAIERQRRDGTAHVTVIG